MGKLLLKYRIYLIKMKIAALAMLMMATVQCAF